MGVISITHRFHFFKFLRSGSAFAGPCLLTAFFLILPVSDAHAVHGINVTATGGLDAQVVLTVLLYNPATDGGTYYIDWGDSQQSTSSLVFGNTTLTWNHTYGSAGTYNV